MNKLILSTFLVSALAACSSDDGGDSTEQLPYPVLENDNTAAIDVSRGNYACYDMTTSLGVVGLAVDELYAPTTAANFEDYVSVGFYDGLIFHRVIDNFVIQGGGFEPGLAQREPGDPIAIESRNGLKNYRGRLAMARTSVPNSATSQFYINVVDNAFLDQANAADGYGYTVFGGVISGMDVVDQIRAVETGNAGGFSDVPVEDVLINSIFAVDCPN